MELSAYTGSTDRIILKKSKQTEIVIENQMCFNLNTRCLKYKIGYVFKQKYNFIIGYKIKKRKFFLIDSPEYIGQENP